MKTSFKDFLKEDSTLKINEVSDEEIQFFENFNIKDTEVELTKLVEKLIGVKPKLSIAVATDRRGNKILTLTSDNLAVEMKPRMFRKLTVENFGGGYYGRGEYWMPVNYAYEMARGSNGTTIAEVWFDANGKIKNHRVEL
jgi:hypothetical protein